MAFSTAIATMRKWFNLGFITALNSGISCMGFLTLKHFLLEVCLGFGFFSPDLISTSWPMQFLRDFYSRQQTYKANAEEMCASCALWHADYIVVFR